MALVERTGVLERLSVLAITFTMTFSTTTPSTMTLSITIKSATLGKNDTRR